MDGTLDKVLLDIQEDQAMDEDEDELIEETVVDIDLSLLPVEFFIIDTETTGCAGIPIWHPNNCMIQLSIRHLASGQEYQTFCIPSLENWGVPAESTLLHTITRSRVLNEGKPINLALKDFFSFIHTHNVHGKKVCLVAHNAPFDIQILFKECEFAQVKHDINNSLDYIYYDTLEAFRSLYPEIGNNSSPSQRPYRLENLVSYFLRKTQLEKYHDASFDTLMLTKLFIHHLLPVDLDDNTMYQETFSNSWLEKNLKHGILKRLFPTRHEPFCKIKFLRNNNFLNVLSEKINADFVKFGTKRYQTSVSRFAGKHILAWAVLQHAIIKDTETEYWHFICKIVEQLLRTLPGQSIHYDDIILQVLEIITQTSAHDLIRCNDPYFPNFAGKTISYGELRLSPDDAKLLYEKWKITTAHDFLVKYLVLDINDRTDWLQKIALSTNLNPLSFLNITQIRNVLVDEMLAILSFKIPLSRKYSATQTTLFTTNMTPPEGMAPNVKLPYVKTSFALKDILNQRSALEMLRFKEEKQIAEGRDRIQNRIKSFIQKI